MIYTETIFPPLEKPIVETTEVVHTKPDYFGRVPFEFWFVDVTDKATNIKTKQLMVRCPVCDTTYCFREVVASETGFRIGFARQKAFYYPSVIKGCPAFKSDIDNHLGAIEEFEDCYD